MDPTFLPISACSANVRAPSKTYCLVFLRRSEINPNTRGFLKEGCNISCRSIIEQCLQGPDRSSVCIWCTPGFVQQHTPFIAKPFASIVQTAWNVFIEECSPQ